MPAKAKSKKQSENADQEKITSHFETPLKSTGERTLRSSRSVSTPRFPSSEQSPMEAKEESMKEFMLEINNLHTSIGKLEKTQHEMNTKLAKLDTIENSLKSLQEKVTDMDQNFAREILSIKTSISKNANDISQFKDEMLAVQIELETVKSQTKHTPSINKEIKDSLAQIYHMQSLIVQQAKVLRSETAQQKEYSQKQNLLFAGIIERCNENCVRIIDSICFTKLQLPNAHKEIDLAHRLGPYRPDHVRPIIVRFKSQHAKEVTLSRRGLLKGTGIFINPHISEEKKKQEHLGHQILEMAKEIDQSCRRTGSRIVYKGKNHSIESLKQSDLPIHKIHQRENEETIGFLGELSPLSNFYYSPFELDGQKFPSVEHFFQQKKSEFYGDMRTAAKISLAAHPLEAKILGKSITLPNGEIPIRNTEAEFAIMKRGIGQKFKNPALREFLVQTTPKRLVECSKDKVYGSGYTLSEFETKSKYPMNGSNVLGKALMEIREKLLR